MKSIVTMYDGEGSYLTFVINEDGTGKITDTNEVIEDFGTTFEILTALGYEIVAETNLATMERKGKAEIISFPDNRDAFRNQWYDYLSENSDNLELEFTM